MQLMSKLATPALKDILKYILFFVFLYWNSDGIDFLD